jgi:hypothetical protein
MRTSSTKNSLIIGISIVLGASLLSAGISNASGSTIKACAKKSNGAMRLIDSAKKCKSSERTLSWGTKGASGAKGAAGANGVSSVLVKQVSVTEISVNSPSAVLSAPIPKGKYSFQFSSELVYFNDNVPTLNERNLACLITTNADGPTSASSSSLYKDMVLWPVPGDNIVLRTTFPPSEASSATFAGRAYAISGTLDIVSDTNIYLQCRHEQKIGDPASSGQLAIFYSPTLTLIKTDEIVNLDISN